MDKKSQIIDREPQTIEEEREKWCEHIPKIYQETYRRAMAALKWAERALTAK